MARIDQSVAKGYPPECAAIKALFHQQSYRQCIQACRGLLKVNGLDLDQRPLHKSFVLFYLALSHDEMARGMHHASVSKVPSFDSAEQFYLDALAALPTKEECRTFWEMRMRCAQEQALLEEDSQSDFGTASSLAEEDTFDDRDVRTTAAPHFAFFSRPKPRQESLRFRTPTASPQLSAADNDDLESHESFSQLMTPSRLSRRDSLNMPAPDTLITWKKPYTMPRDYSRMSLVEPKTPPIAQGLPRESSRMSLIDFDRKSRPGQQTLMRPIRLGSPAKPYYLPPPQPPSTDVKRLSCRIPQRMSTPRPEEVTPRLEEPTPRQEEWTPRWHSPEPVSPISPISASPVRSSPVSVISVDSFPNQARADTPLSFESEPEPEKHVDESEFLWHVDESGPLQHIDESGPLRHIDESGPLRHIDESGLLRLYEHVDAMRIQMKTHVILVHHAKRQLERTLEARDQARAGVKNGLSLKTGPGALKTPSPPGSRLQKSRSFWSFVPEDAKKAEMKRRIQAGKERKWARKRFSPERYQRLCEVALDEL
ncbi:unnamed protein product [Zymoseptoria tritici ST99CH_1A5]|uniref:Uncharacterized protein n=2 Tax=Zymoseptoria tritici TaxID=1047171 RepID=A0A2H1GGZ2_ZYMTR|nr:unnamed protein product [Zymoseptoria tritici ST99CH_1E4]SMY24553.1 unnamed protein product [Zymoseptoria tritici ST99CH_1A5]